MTPFLLISNFVVHIAVIALMIVSARLGWEYMRPTVNAPLPKWNPEYELA